mmetsp:Transcript_126363/g.300020  ORF Transcript_126363/g.300020 Transcript_126363/m.300020 type:complete len:227 (+) Transcript_126363:321-1001(+)
MELGQVAAGALAQAYDGRHSLNTLRVWHLRPHAAQLVPVLHARRVFGHRRHLSHIQRQKPPRVRTFAALNQTAPLPQVRRLGVLLQPAPAPAQHQRQLPPRARDLRAQHRQDLLRLPPGGLLAVQAPREAGQIRAQLLHGLIARSGAAHVIFLCGGSAPLLALVLLAAVLDRAGVLPEVLFRGQVPSIALRLQEPNRICVHHDDRVAQRHQARHRRQQLQRHAGHT